MDFQGSFVNQCNRFSFFYLISAVITLFCNILLDHHNSTSQSDIQLIKEMPASVCGFLGPQLSPSIAHQLKLVNGFITDLADLASCAVVRAGRSLHSEGT